MKTKEKLSASKVWGIMTVLLSVVVIFLAYLTYLAYHSKDNLMVIVMGAITLGALVIWGYFVGFLIGSWWERKRQLVAESAKPSISS